MKRTITVTFELEVPEGEKQPSGTDVATFLAAMLEPTFPESKDPYRLVNPIVFIEAPCVVVGVEGGVVQGVSSEVPTEVLIADYDVNDDDGAVEIPQSGGGTATGWIYGQMAVVDPVWVDSVREAYNHADEEDSVE